MSMTNSNDFKTGLTIQYENNIYIVLEFQHVKPGKGAAFVRSKLRNLRTGAVIEKTFRAGEKMPKAQIDKTEMQYLYADGSNHVFMDNSTYEQVEIPEVQIKDALRFMYETMDVNIMFYGTEVLGVILPDKVTLEITECDPGVKGDTKTNASKDATLQTGHKIKVPLFIEQNERVVINTTTGEYVSREK